MIERKGMRRTLEELINEPEFLGVVQWHGVVVAVLDSPGHWDHLVVVPINKDRTLGVKWTVDKAIALDWFDQFGRGGPIEARIGELWLASSPDKPEWCP